ncbi:MAG: hypothetical protein KAW17_02625 [Candidatus Eisenbacteria sp.]|nr:hypothetical protein [Candidatus Eisenbacteria bacterium]
MRRIPFTLLIAIVAVALVTPGCDLLTGSDESNSDEPLPVAPSELNLTFGGYEPENEDAGFGDPTILAEFTDDAEQFVDDEIAQDPEVLAMENMPETDVYFLRITWGHLEREGSSEMDWSGSASVINGAIVVRKTILFDAGDYIHRPREDRRTLEWTSYTYDHLDGLSLIVFDPPSILTDDAVLNQFSFETGPYSHTFDIYELANLDTVITVDNDGNAIHFTSVKREPGLCKIGFMRGEWFRRGIDWGEFRGGWIGEDEELRGHIHGIWGYDADGRNVLFGKYVDIDGNFMGLLRGTFGRHPTTSRTDGVGWFRGHWFDKDHEVQGAFAGRWKEPRGRGNNGYFRGIWGRDCPYLEADLAQR